MRRSRKLVPSSRRIAIRRLKAIVTRVIRTLILALLLLPLVGATPRVELSDRLADLRVEDGQVVLPTDDGGVVRLDGDAFVRLVDRRQGERDARGLLYTLLDITGPLGVLWVAVGFAGQAVFTGRMIVQWVTSERAKRSVVPTSFWWMSLVGATMLLAYFVWRTDIVGIIGQAAGWVVYARNLLLIRRQPRVGAPAA